MRTLVNVDPNFISGKVDFSCIEENESFDVYMNMLDTDRIIELAEIGKKILNSQEDNYECDDQIGNIHIDKEETRVKSYAGKFKESSLTTKNFVILLTRALLYYELIDNPDEFEKTILGNLSIREAIKNEVEKRLSSDVEITRLKKKEAMGK